MNNTKEETTIESIDERISLLEEKVEKLTLLDRYKEMQADWDKSIVKIVSTVTSTYIILFLLLGFLKVENYPIAALVSSIGVLISSYSIPFIKRVWFKNTLKHDSKKLKEQDPSNKSAEESKVFENVQVESTS